MAYLNTVTAILKVKFAKKNMTTSLIGLLVINQNFGTLCDSMWRIFTLAWLTVLLTYTAIIRGPIGPKDICKSY